VTNVLYDFENFVEGGECFSIAPGVSGVMSYLSTYPDFKSNPGMYVQTISPDEMCTSDNKNYVEFYQTPLSNLPFIFNTCLPNVDEGNSFIYSSSSCASTGHVYLFAYPSLDCTGDGEMYSLFNNDCEDDDGDDDGDDGDDDDDYELTDVTENDFCT
jgi:hypothetical protein